LERALNCVVARHEALRTTFEPDRKQLQEVIAPRFVVVPTIEEARLSSHPHPNDFIAAFIREEARKPFNLRLGPLLRARLIHFAPDDHLLLITVHHIVSDGWSNRVLLRDLFVCYAAFIHNQIPVLPELSLQFADYAEWLTTQLASD